METNPLQSDYLAKRARLLSLWRWIGPLSLLAVVGLAAWIFFTSPLLINPYEIATRIESGTIDQSTLEMMAVLLPLVIIFIFILLVSIIAIMHAALSIERRYMRLLDETKRTRHARPPRG